MTHSANTTEEASALEHSLATFRDGTEGTDPILVTESDKSPYQLWSVPRWNKDIGLVENTYEVFNTTTRVVESRIRANIVTVTGVFEALVEMYQEFEAAGSVKAMDAREENPLSAKTH